MVEAAATSPNLLSLFGLNGPLFVAQLVNFLIVAAVLYRFVYKPLLAAMDARAKKIESGLLQANAAESVLQDAHRQAARVVHQAEEEARALLERTHVEAGVKRRELLQETHQELERQVLVAREQIQEERISMLHGARRELVDLVIKSTDQVTQQILRTKDQRTLLEETVKDSVKKMVV